MIKAPIGLQELRRRIYRKAKAEVVCNALKLSHFTAVKMSHPGRVVSSLFAEILIV